MPSRTFWENLEEFHPKRKTAKQMCELFSKLKEVNSPLFRTAVSQATNQVDEENEGSSVDERSSSFYNFLKNLAKKEMNNEEKQETVTLAKYIFNNKKNVKFFASTLKSSKFKKRLKEIAYNTNRRK